MLRFQTWLKQRHAVDVEAAQGPCRLDVTGPGHFVAARCPRRGWRFRASASELEAFNERLRQHETLSQESFWQSYLDLLLCIALHCFALLCIALHCFALLCFVLGLRAVLQSRRQGFRPPRRGWC